MKNGLYRLYRFTSVKTNVCSVNSMKAGIFVVILCFMMCVISPAVKATPVITNGDFSDPVALAGYTATGTIVSEPTGEFAQLETDPLAPSDPSDPLDPSAFVRTLEQTFTIPSLPTQFFFDFAFSTDGSSFGCFPDFFTASMYTTGDDGTFWTWDDNYLDILVVDGWGVVPDPSDGWAGVTPIDVMFDPSITIAGFIPFTGGTTYSGRVSLWLPDEVLGEDATIYFDLYDEFDGLDTIAAVDNISAVPIPEPTTFMLLFIALGAFLGLYGIKARRAKAMQVERD